MANGRFDKKWSEDWAYDISIDVLKAGEVWDKDVIDQSIEMILTTMYGERFFNPTFGSSLPIRVFSLMTEGTGEQLLDEVAAALKRWEDRITVLESEMKLYISNDTNTIRLVIPYIINSRNIKSTFKKEIVV